jgi:hypothetical protein
MMDSDERDVYHHLKSRPEQFIPANSICRHAGGKHKFRQSPDWAKPALLRMVERGILEVDDTGGYRLKPRPQSDSTSKRWVSPQIAAILKKSGRKFDEVIKANDDDDDAYYNGL